MEQTSQDHPIPAQSRPDVTAPRRVAFVHHWRAFCEQWRHAYLLLLGLFCLVWRMAASMIPQLEATRFMGGLHPVDVLWLMYALKPLWLLPLALAILYVLSFTIKPLNTAAAVAMVALCASVLLAGVLLLALLRLWLTAPW